MNNSSKLIPAFEHRAELREALLRHRKDVEGRTKIANLSPVSPQNPLPVLQTMAKAIVMVLANRLSYADIVVWKSGMFSAATYGYEMFSMDALNPSVIPPDVQWWTFEGRLHETLSKASAGLIEQQDADIRLQSVIVVPFMLPDTEIPNMVSICYVMRSVKKEDKIPYLFLAPASSEMKIPIAAAPIVAAMSFMTQQFVTTRKAHCGRKIKLPGGIQHQSSYDVVVLRSKRMNDPRGDHDAATREYHHSWAVRGHWRRLAEPRKSDGAKATYISSYLKGDPESPFLPQRERIIRVKR